ncbi:hypothetical protein PC129_g14828 [Phytophthora cactorum]|uniref:Uncharacterized protein n=1 Tax=Phytophthora cactorum TaxID=29920 RepID=A0A329RRF5_9STRA|nr:hypothetical protein GQ600_14419 [Phytophthora cactorum]KAG2759391.1 hypothetical protein Pcac1_g28564 [Phytophthora cactorum]KAG2809461.1 hypothetical protein PC112_g16493 [Phytophthora cactorum]KAG2811101.1 hypothetical protein PC111_g15372 [Phytophthora cactorum]KAG2850750.1 hypothetical protein PC113_g16511 [Phytophthora cactorum]
MAEQSDIPDGQLDVYHGAYPLWKYLLELFDINIVDVCPRVSKDEPVLKTEFGNFAVRTVDLPSENKLPPTHNNDVIFLVNSINVVFESLKAGIESDGAKILQSYRFKLDKWHNLYLTTDDESEIPLSSKALKVVKLEDPAE